MHYQLKQLNIFHGPSVQKFSLLAIKFISIVTFAFKFLFYTECFDFKIVCLISLYTFSYNVKSVSTCLLSHRGTAVAVEMVCLEQLPPGWFVFSFPSLRLVIT